MELREYQQRSINQLYDWFRNNQGNPCLNLPTGSGKSIIIASLCQDALTNWPDTKIILLTHVKELIEQDTRQILNVWPDAPVGVYSASVGVKKLGYPITVAGIQSIRHKAKKVGHIDLCIVDECFIAGTLIKTPHGDIPIERLRPGDKVFNALGVGKIEAISQKETTNLIRLEFDDGTITSCTENHPFFTSNGWKKAGELENGTHILSFKEMRILWESFYPVDKKRRGRGIYLRNARKTLGKTKILFNFLCEKSRKPHERQTKQREDETNTSANTAQAHSKGRKWETASIASARAASCTWGRLGGGICCEHRGQEQVSPLCLQNRHSKSCAKNSDRGRRTVTQHNGAKGAGHKENKPFNFVRVVSVSRVKCGSPCAVFNLQVSGHPSYFADEHLVHNCHLISHKAEGRYRTFIDDLRAINPNLRVIGLTATPYRLGHGLITDKPAIFDAILEPTSIEELLAHGYLSPLRSKRPDNLLSTDGVNKRGGEFIEAELQKAVNKKDQNLRVACEIIRYAEERKAWLIFCTGVAHAHAMAELLQGLDIPTACITGETPKNEREAIVEGFKTGRLRALTNANCLTTGFDYPDIDLIAMCRPTLSPGLYCLDEETEVLTANGWKKEISVNEMVAGFNTQTKEIQYVPALNTIRRHLFNDEFFCSIKGPSVDIRVTNKHRMLYDTKNKTGWKFKNAEEIASLSSGCYLPVAGNSKFKGVPLTNAELTFIGWVMTDGSINKTTNAIAITQGAHQPYLDEIEGCIKDCGFKFTRTQKKRRSMFHSSSDTVLWTISKGAPRGRDKHLTGWGRLEPWLSKDLSPLLFDMTAGQFATMLEAINHGDGHKNPWKAYHIGKGNKIFIERLQIMAIQRGYRASVSIERANVVRQSDLYILHIKKQEYVNIGSTHDKRPSWIKEPFKPESCWCVENELGTLVTRRNGKVVIVGNCQMAGRGMRVKSHTDHCLVLDFAGNVRTHGPIMAVRPPDRKGQGHGEAPVKVCENCQEFVTLSTRVCPACGWEFPAPEIKPLRLHDDDIMGNSKTMRVKSWLWRVYTSNSGKEMVTITYFSADNLAETVTEYLCLLHGGYAQDKAQRLLSGIAKRSGAVIENPYDLEGIVSTMNTVPAPTEITKERDGKYYRVTARVWNHAA